MKFCDAFQIDLPDTFPLAEWESLLDLGRQCTLANNEAGGEFVRAMGAAAYRYRAADEALLSMISEWIANDRTLPFEAKYRQQRDLFAFFSCSLSAVESALYACYVVLTQRQPSAALWTDLKARKQDFHKTLPGFLASAYPGSCLLTAAIRSLTSSPEWKELNDLRNTLLHRALPSQLAEGGIGGWLPPVIMVKYASSWSNPELRQTEMQMKARLEWVASHLKAICDGGANL